MPLTVFRHGRAYAAGSERAQIGELCADCKQALPYTNCRAGGYFASRRSSAATWPIRVTCLLPGRQLRRSRRRRASVVLDVRTGQPGAAAPRIADPRYRRWIATYGADKYQGG